MTYPTLLESLDAIQKRVDAVEDLPWEYKETSRTVHGTKLYTVYGHEESVKITDELTERYAEIIAHAPTDIFNLVKALRVANDKLIEDCCCPDMADADFCSSCEARNEMAKILANEAI